MSETVSWDTLIRNALIFDGTGQPPVREDLAIAGGRIAARGPSLPAEQAREVVEADGQWLMPGLLDIHTHFDLEVELAPGLPEAVRHGTTTVVFGNCSLGLAYGAQRRNGEDPIVDCFARVENIPKPVLAKVVDQVQWSDSAGYLAHFDALPAGSRHRRVHGAGWRVAFAGWLCHVQHDRSFTTAALRSRSVDVASQLHVPQKG